MKRLMLKKKQKLLKNSCYVMEEKPKEINKTHVLREIDEIQ